MPYKDPANQRRAAKAHYERNKPAYKQRARAHTKQNAAATKLFVLDYLRTHPCIGCGEDDPIVLQFDHRPNESKRFNLGNHRQRGMSLKSIVDEIAKCDVRCANCHQRITYQRAGYTHKNCFPTAG